MKTQTNFTDYAQALLMIIDEVILYTHKRINYMEFGGLDFILWMRGTNYGLHDIRIIINEVLRKQNTIETTTSPFSFLMKSVEVYASKENPLISEEGTAQSHESLKRINGLLQKCVETRSIPDINEFITKI